jgi:SseB protein N-terminal domain
MTTSSVDLIDRAIVRTRNGELGMQTLLWVFASRVVLVASTAEPQPDLSDLQPVLFERDGESLLTVFTNTVNSDLLAAEAPYLVAVAGEDLIRRMPDGVGIVVNPRSQLGFEVPARGVAAFRTEISA